MRDIGISCSAASLSNPPLISQSATASQSTSHEQEIVYKDRAETIIITTTTTTRRSKCGVCDGMGWDVRAVKDLIDRQLTLIPTTLTLAR